MAMMLFSTHTVCPNLSRSPSDTTVGNWSCQPHSQWGINSQSRCRAESQQWWWQHWHTWELNYYGTASKQTMYLTQWGFPFIIWLAGSNPDIFATESSWQHFPAEITEVGVARGKRISGRSGSRLVWNSVRATPGTPSNLEGGGDER